VHVPQNSLRQLRQLRQTISSLFLIVLRGNNAILLDLALVHIAHCRHEFKGRGGRLSSKALDDVVLVRDLLPVSKTLSTFNLHSAHEHDRMHGILHTTPFAFLIASLASSTMWSGVSLGQLMMTERWGATAMAKVARAAMRREKIVKRMAKYVEWSRFGCGEFSGCVGKACGIVLVLLLLRRVV
jgi:hypothetical protein